jgi:hypothetical protein
MTDPTRTPIADALGKLEDLPPGDSITVGGVATREDAGIGVEVQRDIGDPGGWTFATVAEYWKSKGASIAGLFRWTPRPKP